MLYEVEGSDSIKMEIVITKDGTISTSDPNALVLYAVWNDMMLKAKQDEREEILALIKSRGET